VFVQKFNSYENAPKLLPPELLLLIQICTKSFVGCGFAPGPTGGAYSAPPDCLAGLAGGAPPPGKGKEGGRGKRGEGGSPGMPKSRVGKPIASAQLKIKFVHHLVPLNKYLSSKI